MDASTVFAPLVALFRDRVFVTALLSALGAVIVSLVPALAPYIGQVIAVAVTLIILAAGGSVVMSAVNKVMDTKTEQAHIQLQTVQAQTELAKAQWATGRG